MTPPGRVDRRGLRARRWLALVILGMVAFGCNLLVGIGDLPSPDSAAPDGSVEASGDGADAADVRVDAQPGDAPVVDSGADSPSRDGDAPDGTIRDGDATDSLDAGTDSVDAPEDGPDGGDAMGMVTAVTAGQNHTCALLAQGTVVCWGANESGELGNGTYVLSTVPVPVTGLIGGTTAIAAGEEHTCALDSAGGVVCWGWGGDGQIGNGLANTYPTPHQVQLPPGVATAIASGQAHSCALMTTGTVYCWGDNAGGDLGNGTTVQANAPVAVLGADGGTFVATAITAGSNHTCAIVPGNGVACWGMNNRGQLGIGSAGGSSLTPTPVPGLTGATSIAAGGNFTCAVVAGGKVQCWGNDSEGQLGNGNLNQQNSPVFTSVGQAALTVVAGAEHTCAQMADMSVQCWGSNSSGQLGNGTVAMAVNPVTVPSLGGVTALAAGTAHSCAVTNGNVVCWGYDGYGQLGIGAPILQVTPVAVPIGGPVSAVACGSQHTCAMVAEAGVECWGANTDGELGNGTLTQQNSPGQVMGVPSALAIAGGDSFTCAVLPNGTVECWGRNPQGELGDGTTVDRPAPVVAMGVTGAVDIAAGLSHTCVKLSDGGMECWGYAANGQLANGASDGGTMSAPMPVLGLSGAVAQIAAGGYHTCAVMADGTAECWGDNGFGQVGAGADAGAVVSAPTRVVGLSGVLQVASGVTHTCALLAADGGTVDCWGFNGDGELGMPGAGKLTSPAPVLGLSGVVKLVAGQYHTCAVLVGGAVECWGQDQYGQLGNGAIVSGSAQASPTTVQGLTAPQSVAAGYDHTCAIVGGGLVCWGQDGQGQLGNGGTTQSNIPLPVQ